MYKRVLDIKPGYATAYAIYLLDRKKSMFRKPPERTGTRMLSQQSRRLLMTAVNWLTLFSPERTFYCSKRKKFIKFRINFITLTLACYQVEDDDYIKNRLLQPFIKWMLRQGATAYIWKAETQNNGNIHFHITTNIYIHWRAIRDKWNTLQQDHGFLNDYQEQYKSNDPNSTDVHSVHKYADLVNNVGNYFGKVEEWCKRKGSKVNQAMLTHPSAWLDDCHSKHSAFPVPKRQVDGRKWAVSNNLTGIRCSIDDESLRGTEFEDIYKHFLDNTEHRTLTRDFADIYIYDEQKLFSNMHPVILDCLSDRYNEFVQGAPRP